MQQHPSFPELPFDQMNEADVREEVIAPLIRALGYVSGTSANVVREQPLKYPRSFFGRKDVKRDQELRGRADYILEIDGRLRWVVEAKPPAEDISADAIEQAYSYARHPEVRGLYFAVCNGRELQVFLTANAPTVPPVLTIRYDEYATRFDLVANVLGPDAVRRDFPNVAPDPFPPIAPGLRSVARVLSGTICYERASVAHPILSELQVAIVEGSIERDEGGNLVAYLETNAPTRTQQQFNEALGINRLFLRSTEPKLSSEPAAPTVFSFALDLTLPAGTLLPNMLTGTPFALTRDSTLTGRASIGAVLVGPDRVEGPFKYEVRIDWKPDPLVLQGRFWLRIS